MVRWRLIPTLALTAISLHTQPAFEVASIKPADPNANGTSVHMPPGQIVIENFSLKDCIKRAFEIKDFALSGPPWLDSARFNITAKYPAGTPMAQIDVMLQSLLVERFKLAFHHETKTVPAYALILARNGLKLQPGDPKRAGGTTMGRGLVGGTGMTMGQIADLLSTHVDRPVVDKTSVTGM